MGYKNGILRLINLYVFSEQQYIHAAINSSSPVLKKFFEQRAFERTGFIEDLEGALQSTENSAYPLKKLKELYSWHTNHYGKNSLGATLIQDLDSIMFSDSAMNLFTIDKQALEISDYLTTIYLPSEIWSVLKEQVIKIESGIVSMAYLKGMYE